MPRTLKRRSTIEGHATLSLMQVFELLSNIDFVVSKGVKTVKGKTEKYRISTSMEINILGKVTFESEYSSDDKKLIPFAILSCEQKKILNKRHIGFRFSIAKRLSTGEKVFFCFPLTKNIVTKLAYM